MDGERGAVPYEVVCTECGSLTPGVMGPGGRRDLDELLVCGHDPIRRDVLVHEVVRSKRPDG